MLLVTFLLLCNLLLGDFQETYKRPSWQTWLAAAFKVDALMIGNMAQ